MLEQLKDSIEVLRKKIQYNKGLIYQNENEINEILNETVSGNRTEKLKEKFDYIKEMLAENNDTLKLRQNIIKYLETYDDDSNKFISLEELNRTTKSKAESISDFIELELEDYFKLTVDGVIEFNKYHPYYNDEKFLNDLLKYHTQNENYEVCSMIVKHKKLVARNI